MVLIVLIRPLNSYQQKKIMFTILEFVLYDLLSVGILNFTWYRYCLWRKGAQLDAHPTGDQNVAGLTSARSVIFFFGDLIMKYFLRSFSPFC